MWLKLSMRSLCVIFADSLARFSSNFLICTRDRSTHHSARQSEHRDHSVRWGMSACTAIPVHPQLAAVETAHLLVPLLLVGRARVGNVERRACLLHFLLARGLLPFRPRDSDLGAALLLLSARTHVESDKLARQCAHSNTPLGPKSSARPTLEEQRQSAATRAPAHAHFVMPPIGFLSFSAPPMTFSILSPAYPGKEMKKEIFNVRSRLSRRIVGPRSGLPHLPRE